VSNTPTLPPPDPTDMIGLHNVFREALDAAPGFLGSVSPGDEERAETVAAYYFNVLELLRSHHAGEDALLTPKLLERCPERAADIERIAEQHEAVHDAMVTAASLVGPWRADPTGSELASALAALQSGLLPHVIEEEKVLLPLVVDHINVVEWGELPAHGLAHFEGDKVWLILGLVQEQLTAAQVAAMEDHMPPPVVEFWRSTGRDTFLEFVGRLRA
jgi:Hemerythrin HHE cation binding domain